MNIIHNSMTISEQNKQEAEKVYWYYGKCLGIEMTYKEAIQCAIQDRQSVLEYATKQREKYNRYHDNIDIDILKEITNLNEQINYLKNKL